MLAVVVALAALEITKDVALEMAVMMTVSGLVAVSVTPVAVAVAATVKVKLVEFVTVTATVSFAGIPVPEMTVPADKETGAEVVTVVLPLVTLAVNVVMITVVGMPVPLMIIPCVSALVEAVVTVVLPLVVSAVMVEDNPLRVTHGLPELWQATQNVWLPGLLYMLVPRLGVGDGVTPLMLTLEVKPSWL